MKALALTSFRKTAACPSETILVSYKAEKLSQEIMKVVSYHLVSCDFCNAELTLLRYYSQPNRSDCKAPDIPMNLRILAESLFRRRTRNHLQIAHLPDCKAIGD